MDICTVVSAIALPAQSMMESDVSFSFIMFPFVVG